jgi:hypothetical protein
MVYYQLCIIYDTVKSNLGGLHLVNQALLGADSLPVVKDKPFPFVPLTLNAETIEAIKAAPRGELVTIGKPGRLFARLG